MSPYALTGTEWNALKDLLPPEKSGKRGSVLLIYLPRKLSAPLLDLSRHQQPAPQR